MKACPVSLNCLWRNGTARSTSKWWGKKLFTAQRRLKLSHLLMSALSSSLSLVNPGVLSKTVISRPLSVPQFGNSLDCRGNQLWNGRRVRFWYRSSVQRCLERKFRPAPPSPGAHTQMRNWLPNTTDPLRLTLSGNSWTRGVIQHTVTPRVKAISMGIKESGLKIAWWDEVSKSSCNRCRKKKEKKSNFLLFHPVPAWF